MHFTVNFLSMNAVLFLNSFPPHLPFILCYDFFLLIFQCENSKSGKLSAISLIAFILFATPVVLFVYLKISRHPCVAPIVRRLIRIRMNKWLILLKLLPNTTASTTPMKIFVICFLLQVDQFTNVHCFVCKKHSFEHLHFETNCVK